MNAPTPTRLNRHCPICQGEAGHAHPDQRQHVAGGDAAWLILPF